MKKTRKILALLLVALMIFMLAACGGTDDTDGGNTDTGGGSSDGGSSGGGGNADGGGNSGGSGGDSSGGGVVNPGRPLNIAIGQDSGTLHPLGVTGGFIGILDAFYEPLFVAAEDGSTRWVLATGLDRISELQATLTIREGVTFSNGNPLTAEDVMFSMELCATNPQFALNVKVVDFEKTSVTGEYTIDLWYTEYNASQEPGFAAMDILDKESYDEVALSREPIGTGPYICTEYIVNSHATLVARDDYWGGPVPIQNVTYKIINEPAQIVNALTTGEIDIASIQIADVDYIRDLGYNVEVTAGGMNYVTMYSMRPESPLYTKEARWAVNFAIDRQAIANILFEGLATLTDYPVSHALIDFEPRFLNTHETYSLGYNPTRARELAEESGLVGQTLRIITNGSSGYNTVAEIVQGNLMDIGVNVDIVNYEQATYFPMMMDASNFEIAIFTPAAPSYLASDLLAMYITFIPLGWEGPDRDRYGEISMGALCTADPARASELLYETVQMFAEFSPWYGLCESVGARAMAQGLNIAVTNIAGGYFPQDLYWD